MQKRILVAGRGLAHIAGSLLLSNPFAVLQARIIQISALLGDEPIYYACVACLGFQKKKKVVEEGF